MKPSAGDGLLHPVVVAALAGLILNDHVLKAAAAGSVFSDVTGKLSDVCGVLFLPVLLLAGLELVQSVLARWRGPSVRAAVVVCAAVAVSFALMKTVPVCGAAFQWTLGALQWPFHAAAAVVAGEAVPGLRKVRHVLDATDLIAVPFAFFALRQARSRASSWARSG